MFKDEAKIREIETDDFFDCLLSMVLASKNKGTSFIQSLFFFIIHIIGDEVILYEFCSDE